MFQQINVDVTNSKFFESYIFARRENEVLEEIIEALDNLTEVFSVYFTDHMTSDSSRKEKANIVGIQSALFRTLTLNIPQFAEGSYSWMEFKLCNEVADFLDNYSEVHAISSAIVDVFDKYFESDQAQGLPPAARRKFTDLRSLFLHAISQAYVKSIGKIETLELPLCEN